MRRGRVARVDRRHPTPQFGGPRHRGIHIERQRPGAGYRHVLRKRDIAAFIDLLPDWDELSAGLEAVVIAGGWPDCFGWYEPGMIALGAWPRGRDVIIDAAWVDESDPILRRLEVPRQRVAGDRWRLTFDDRAARGFLLLDVLLHELGHHHDRMSTRTGVECPRGEGYAIEYAERRADELWERYVAVFG